PAISRPMKTKYKNDKLRSHARESREFPESRESWSWRARVPPCGSLRVRNFWGLRGGILEERQAAEVGRSDSGAVVQARWRAWSEVSCALQWLQPDAG